MPKVKVIILRTAGTNCDLETAFAFEKVNADCELVHVNRLVAGHKKLKNYHILAIPGGFTYGDDIASGKILANEIKYKLKDDIVNFIRSGKLIIGICNGFQVLVKSGLLPNTGGSFDKIESTLSINDSGKFEDRWVYLKTQKCTWLRGLDDVIYLPVAHGEGKFISRNNGVLKDMKKNNQLVLKYCGENGKSEGYPHNPNGSLEDIAGICDVSGRIFGLMPHPERHILRTQHPRWTRMQKKYSPSGLQIFRNGVYAASRI